MAWADCVAYPETKAMREPARGMSKSGDSHVFFLYPKASHRPCRGNKTASDDTHRAPHRDRTAPPGAERQLVCTQTVLRAHQRLLHLQTPERRHRPAAAHLANLETRLLHSLSRGDKPPTVIFIQHFRKRKPHTAPQDVRMAWRNFAGIN